MISDRIRTDRARPTPHRGRRRWAAIAGGAAFALSAGCAADGPRPPEQAAVGVRVGAIAACGGASADPFSQIATLELKVRESAGGVLKSVLKNPATVALKAGQTSVSFSNVAAGSPREVTLLGYAPGSTTATWFARRTGENIKKNETNTLDMTLMAVEGFTCVGAKSMPNALFPAAVAMDKGRVLITGGYTNAVADGALVRLESATDRAYIFDPGSGSFTQTADLLKEARAGHSMVYLPKPNQVLIVGGAKKMTVPVAGNEPPTWLAGDAVGLAYEIFDVASGKFIPGPDSGQNCKKRVFPNLMTLTDDYVVALGGAPWPYNDTDFYSKGDLYNPKRGQGETTGRFQDVGNALQLNATRAGAALAYIGPTENGTSKYLVFGGNTGSASPDGSPLPVTLKHAERFKESTEPGTGEFFADFVLENDPAAGPGFATAKDDAQPDALNVAQALFFPTLSALGRTTVNNKEAHRFLLVGGARFVSYTATKHWLPPSTEDAYILTVIEPTATTKGRIQTKRIAGLSRGVMLHQATMAGAGAVLLTGGFTTFGGAAEATMQAFDLPTLKLDVPEKLQATKAFIKRGGHAALGLRNDCVLLFGGAGRLAEGELSSTTPATSEVYCPRLLVPP